MNIASSSYRTLGQRAQSQLSYVKRASERRSYYSNSRGYAFYSTNPPPPPPRSRNPLVVSAATGFAAGLIFVLAKRYSSPARNCDGSPTLPVVGSDGQDWQPVDAYEQDDPNNPMRIRMALWVKALQDHIVTTLESIEASYPDLPESGLPGSRKPTGKACDKKAAAAPKFLRDHWIRPEGGEGSSCVLSNGRVFEKAGVNVSIVHGHLPPAAQRQMRADHATLPIRDQPAPFFATGISIVLHPKSPHVPTVHLNYRYFELDNPDKPGEAEAWWFGGGTDLTPSYLVPSDVEHFHRTIKEACDKHDERYWPEFKKWCDKYFHIPHRKESRGVGGIFFDDLTTASIIHQPIASSQKPTTTQTSSTTSLKPKIIPATTSLDGTSPGGPSQEQLFSFVKDVSSSFLPSYVPIVLRNMNRPYTDDERRWQLLRRGRYAEFNLVYDRGTKFGLMTPGARIESILMRWEYMTEMGKEGTPEGEIQEVLRHPRDWI